jgi:DNA-binding IclR family transcriptional regulator
VRQIAEPSRWPDIQRGVTRALKEVREIGVCCSFGDWQKDVNAIALPVRPGGGLPPMSINCGAPAYLASKEFLLERVRPRLIGLAAELEAALGTGGA